jgi:hypothetical protein
MLLIDDDELYPAKRGEQGGSGPDDDSARTRAHCIPLIVSFAG